MLTHKNKYRFLGCVKNISSKTNLELSELSYIHDVT